MTFNFMVYMFPTRKGYFSVILITVHHGSSPKTEMHNLSRKDADLHVLLCGIYLSTFASKNDFEVRPWPWSDLFPSKVASCQGYGSRVNGSRVTWLRMVFLLWAVTPEWSQIRFHSRIGLHSLLRFIWNYKSWSNSSFPADLRVRYRVP